MKKIFGVIIIFGILVLGLFWKERFRILEFVRNFKKEQTPMAVSFEEITNTVAESVIEKESATIAASSPVAIVKSPSLNLAVPFTPQAPHGNWQQPYQDACEEASVAMVHYFYSKKIFTPTIADREILDLIAFQKRVFGYGYDTTAEETANFIRNFYGYKNVEVITDPGTDLIKSILAQGLPVIAPVYGKALKNPYFTPPGPNYHMLVIKGYVKDKFITNDPGTRRGADYLYSFDVLLNAIHDWNGGAVPEGRKVIIVIHPN